MPLHRQASWSERARHRRTVRPLRSQVREQIDAGHRRSRSRHRRCERRCDCASRSLRASRRDCRPSWQRRWPRWRRSRTARRLRPRRRARSSLPSPSPGADLGDSARLRSSCRLLRRRPRDAADRERVGIGMRSCSPSTAVTIDIVGDDGGAPAPMRSIAHRPARSDRDGRSRADADIGQIVLRRANRRVRARSGAECRSPPSRRGRRCRIGSAC